jgi:hypothetical protein
VPARKGPAVATQARRAALRHRRDGAEGGDVRGVEWRGHRRLL